MEARGLLVQEECSLSLLLPLVFFPSRWRGEEGVQGLLKETQPAMDPFEEGKDYQATCHKTKPR